VLAALRRGGLDAELSGHVRSCAVCGPAAGAERALRALAAAASEAPLPAPELVLLRARLRARRAAEERSLRPLLLWHRAAAAVAAAGLTAGAALGAPVLGGIAGAGGDATPARLLMGAGLLLLAALAARSVGRHAAGLSAG
jgi:hypothetical protein